LSAALALIVTQIQTRVLEDSPVPRDGSAPFAAIEGNGRMLLAACNINEEALEDPITRHGLFTLALLEALQQGNEPISVVWLIDHVNRRVRADAARLGYVQTPVLFGHVEGEILISVLRRGDIFAREFPETANVRVTADFQDLAIYGIAEPILTQWAARFPAWLNELQLAAINDHNILNGTSLVVVAPTSAGKTFVGELAAMRAAQRGEKTVFLLPYRALVNEKYDEFSELYGDRLGLRVARCSGDWQDQVPSILRGKYDIAFFTYETFLGLALSNAYLLSQIGIVVLDEAQFIADPHRGITVELLLTCLVSARSRGVNPQLLCLSAVIGGTNFLEEWLGCRLLVTARRPVPLAEGVLDRRGVLQLREADGNVQRAQFLPAGAVQQRRNEPSSQDVIVPLVRQLVRDGEKVLIFRNRRGSVQGCANYLAQELGLPPAQGVLDALPELDQTTRSRELRQCLHGGTAFHSTDLRKEERRAIENAFRDPDGPVRVLVATSTVAAGINTPASTVIVVETEFVGAGERTPYTIAQYKNMAGRAGRLGFIEQGKAILLADTPMEAGRLLHTYVEGTPERMVSSFDAASPDTWIIKLLAQVQSVPRPR
jgi:helicase